MKRPRIHYSLHQWKQLDWHHPSNHRYYQAQLKQNLFGQWVLIRLWGSLNRRGGQRLEIACDSYQAGLEKIDSIARRRKKRGYLPIR